MVSAKTIALIPARAGSVRVPGKNIKPLGGFPLIDWTIQAAKTSGVFDEIVVISDSEDILSISAKYGAEISGEAMTVQGQIGYG